MKKFEIPYNFDLNLIELLDSKKYRPYIELIYMPPCRLDYLTAKAYYRQEHSYGMRPIYNENETREEYENHIKKILDYGFEIATLFQKTDIVVPKDMIKYYLNLGVTKFVIGNDETAENIKYLNSNAEVIGSIAKKISLKEFYKNDFSCYDKFVLYFPFNRSLETVKRLPLKFKYVLLVNTWCSYKCSGTPHWFADKEAEENRTFPCPRRGTDDRDTIVILPECLNLFEPYVDTFKLQGREYLTPQILSNFEQYINRKSSTQDFLNLYEKVELVGEDIFYNVASNHQCCEL